MTRWWFALLTGAVLVAAAGCGASGVELERSAVAAVTSSTAPAAPSTTTTTAPPTSTTAPASTTAPPAVAAPASTVVRTRPTERTVVATGFSPFARFAEVVLVHPAADVERIGFHESGHDGARQLEVLSTAARPITMESRERGTGSRTAADIAVRPDSEIRAPVTGTVKRAGRYVLYCQYTDNFVVMEPDAHPGWEVKMFHIDGLQVGSGDRVEAGVTPVSPRARVLEFESQVDELTAEPSWPHVHVELVDPSIPDRPSPGGGCD